MKANGNGYANGNGPHHNGHGPDTTDADPDFVKRLAAQLAEHPEIQHPRRDDATDFRPPLRIRDFDEIDFDPDTETWLVEDLLLTGEVSLFHGPTNSGKTFFALDLSLHIAAERDWFGHKVAGGHVAYIAAEGGKRIDKRIAAWKQHHGYLRKGEKLPFSLISEPVDLCHVDAGDVERIIAAVCSKIGNGPLAVLTIETVNALMNGGNENGPEDMGRLVTNVRRLRDEFGCAVLLIHHPNQGGRGSRGHNSLPCAVDTEFDITKDEESDITTVTMIIQREAEKAAPFCFALEVVELGYSSAGKRVTSCVIVEADDPAEAARPAKAKLNSREQIALTQLVNAINTAGFLLPTSNHGSTGKQGVSGKLWRDYCAAGGIASGEKPNTRRMAIERATEKLISLKLVGEWDGLVWVP